MGSLFSNCFTPFQIPSLECQTWGFPSFALLELLVFTTLLHSYVFVSLVFLCFWTLNYFVSMFLQMSFCVFEFFSLFPRSYKTILHFWTFSSSPWSWGVILHFQTFSSSPWSCGIILCSWTFLFVSMLLWCHLLLLNYFFHFHYLVMSSLCFGGF